MRLAVRSLLPILLSIAALAGSAPAVADPPTLDVPERSDPEPGARGVMLTAIEGNRIEEIPLTFVGTLEDVLGPGYDLVLVRLEGPIADRLGVAAGMSGSPVYVGDRLIGAMSYRLGQLPREPVAGVTPFEDMIAAGEARGSSPPGSDSLARPIATPVQIGGLLGPVEEWIDPHLRRLGFTPVAAGGSGRELSEPAELRPGSPVGVELVRGDLEIAATGTVTSVNGELVYAFGHAFFGSGQVELPMISAEIVHTLADTAGSVKFARYGPAVGTITEDRLTAVVGFQGLVARMIPLELTVRGASPVERRFHFELARHAQLAPVLAGAVVANALLSDIAHDEPATMVVSGAIRIENRPDLPVEMAFAGEGATDPGLSVAASLRRVLTALWFNRLADVEIESVDLNVDMRPELHRYRVASLRYDRGPLRAGQTLDVECTLEPYRGEPRRERFSLKVPRPISPDTPLTLAVGAPDQINLALGRPIEERVASAKDLGALLRALGERRSSHRLVAVLFRPGDGLVTRGEAYRALPPTARRLLGTRSSGAAGTKSLAPLVREEIEMDGPITGGLMVKLHIDTGLESSEESR